MMFGGNGSVGLATGGPPRGMDTVADHYCVTKVKTVGDAYLAIAGLPGNESRAEGVPSHGQQLTGQNFCDTGRPGQRSHARRGDASRRIGIFSTLQNHEYRPLHDAFFFRSFLKSKHIHLLKVLKNRKFFTFGDLGGGGWGEPGPAFPLRGVKLSGCPARGRVFLHIRYFLDPNPPRGGSEPPRVLCRAQNPLVFFFPLKFPTRETVMVPNVGQTCQVAVSGGGVRPIPKGPPTTAGLPPPNCCLDMLRFASCVAQAFSCKFDHPSKGEVLFPGLYWSPMGGGWGHTAAKGVPNSPPPGE